MKFEELIEAYVDCRRHKRLNADALAFEADREAELWKLYCELREGSYQISTVSAFIIQHPVQREIFAGAFRDRIVHHWLIGKLWRLFESEFIYDSYSCRPGKGTVFGVRRVRRFIAQCSENYTQDCWVLKCDLKGFFMSIPRQAMWDRLERFIETRYEGEDKRLVLSLAAQIALHDPTLDYWICCPAAEWRGLPVDKSLFGINGMAMPWEVRRSKGHEPYGSLFGYGLPIGNLTSQWFANFYMSSFDHYVKHTLGVRYYGRYVDDFVIVHKDREYLKGLIPMLERFLCDELSLTLHPNKRWIQHYSKGVAFLGSVIKYGGLYCGKRTKTGMYDAIRRWNMDAEKKVLEDRGLREFCTVINSYWGMMRNTDSYRLRKRSAAKFNEKLKRSIRYKGYRKVSIKR